MSGRVVIVGAGPVGCFCAAALAGTSIFQEVCVYEQLSVPDMNARHSSNGRNINVTLCKRGVDSLATINIKPQTSSLVTVPMTHFELHKIDAKCMRIAYASPMVSHQGESEVQQPSVLHSVTRPCLSTCLQNVAKQMGTKFYYGHKLLSLASKGEGDSDFICLQFLKDSGQIITDTAELVIGADGVHSKVRSNIFRDILYTKQEKENSNALFTRMHGLEDNMALIENHTFGYRELDIAYKKWEAYVKGADFCTLHIWSSSDMVLLCIPSANHMVTLGVYADKEWLLTASHSALCQAVADHFPDLQDCMKYFMTTADELIEYDAEELISYAPVPGTLHSVLLPRFHGNRMVLLGDAAHAMLPFLGQGLNSGLEDVCILLSHLNNWYHAGNRSQLNVYLNAYTCARQADIRVIVEESHHEFDRILQYGRDTSPDTSDQSQTLSRFLQLASFTSLSYRDAWSQSKSGSVSLKPGDKVRKGQVLAQVESVKTVTSVVAPCDGTLVSVEQLPAGMPRFQIEKTAHKADNQSQHGDSFVTIGENQSDQGEPVMPSADVQSGPTDPTMSWAESQSGQEGNLPVAKQSKPHWVYDFGTVETFDVAKFQLALKTRLIGRCLNYQEVTDSTMEDARKVSRSGCLHGTACLAETMTMGRGRQGHSWTAPPRGNIYVTFVLRAKTQSQEVIPMVQFAAALAVMHAVQEAGVSGAKVKWPNDIWIRGHKLAGILVEVDKHAELLSPDSALESVPIYLGIGINVNADTRRNVALRATASSLTCELNGQLVCREQVLASLCNHLEQLLQSSMRDTLQQFSAFHLLQLASRVQILPKDGSTEYEAAVDELQEDGKLCVTDKDGKAQVLDSQLLSLRPVPEATIYIYQGLGAGERSVNSMKVAMETLCDTSKYSIKLIMPEEIRKGDWAKDASLLAIGGGYDLGFMTALGEEGTKVIRDYVHAGGAYLGICAGSYFGCSHIEFDKGGPLEVCGSRQLQFFPGSCKGPVLPGFVYNSEKGAHAAAVDWKLEDGQDVPVHCYFNGGGHFVLPAHINTDSKLHGIQVIATYNQEATVSALTTQATHKQETVALVAAVKCLVGQGVAVLSGVHLEYPVEDLDVSDADLLNVIPKIYKSRYTRDRCFQSILHHLNL